MRARKVTAADLMTRLQRDTLYLEKRSDLDAAHSQHTNELSIAELPLVAALRGVGLPIRSVWDLVNSSRCYVHAIPILLEHLHRDYPAAIRDGIARALAIPESRIGWDQIARLYRLEKELRAKDGLACALAASTDQTTIGELIEMARDAQNGASRLLLLSAIERFTVPGARSALLDLANDPELAIEIKAILAPR